MSPTLERRERGVIVASLLGVYVTLFPFLIVVDALPAMARSLHGSSTTLGWVLTAPLVASAAVLSLAGRLGDLYGHRRIFLTGIAVSALFAVLTGLAWDSSTLILFRTISQAAGSAVGPSAIALAVRAAPGHDQRRMLGYWAFATSMAPASGLIIGGPAVQALSWRGLFLLQGAGALGVVLYGARVMLEDRVAERISFDLRGVALFFVASGALVFTLDRAGQWGWYSPAVVGSFAVVLAAGALFVYVEGRVAEPMIHPSLMRSRAYLAAAGVEFLIQVATNGALYVAPLLFQYRYGASVSLSAWYLVPMPIGMAISSPFGGRVARWIDPRGAALIGTLTLGVSIFGMVEANRAHQLWAILLGWFAAGLANGVIRPAIMSVASAALTPTTYGSGMAGNRSSSTVGAAAGITLAIGFLSAGRQAALIACGVTGILAVAIAALLPAPDGSATAGGPVYGAGVEGGRA